MKVLIVEDDESQAEHLAKSIFKVLGNNIEIVGPFAHFQQSLEKIISKPFDIAILDIQLQEDKYAGIHLAEVLENLKSAPILFVTGLSDEKVLEQTSSINNSHILKKPFDEQSFTRAIGLVISTLGSEQYTPGKIAVRSGGRDKYWIREGKAKFTGVDVKDILYIEAMDHHCRFHIEGQSPLVVKSTLNQGIYNSALAVYDNFIVMGRSFIVNLNHVNKVSGNQMYIGEKGTVRLNIPKNSKDIVLKALGIQS